MLLTCICPPKLGPEMVWARPPLLPLTAMPRAGNRIHVAPSQSGDCSVGWVGDLGWGGSCAFPHKKENHCAANGGLRNRSNQQLQCDTKMSLASTSTSFRFLPPRIPTHHLPTVWFFPIIISIAEWSKNAREKASIPQARISTYQEAHRRLVVHSRF